MKVDCFGSSWIKDVKFLTFCHYTVVKEKTKANFVIFQLTDKLLKKAEDIQLLLIWCGLFQKYI